MENFTPRELELMSKLKTLEDDRVKFLDIVRNKIGKLEHELDVSVQCELSIYFFLVFFLLTGNKLFRLIFHFDFQLKNQENNRLVERNRELECNLKDISSFSGHIKGKGGNKADDDDMLTRAKELLFEKTKVCKKQELQLEALNSQVAATKEVLEITKDMLNLKNIENDHMQSRLESLQERAKCEKDRYLLVDKKLTLANQREIAFTREYQNQRNIFKVINCVRNVCWIR